MKNSKVIDRCGIVGIVGIVGMNNCSAYCMSCSIFWRGDVMLTNNDLNFSSSVDAVASCQNMTTADESTSTPWPQTLDINNCNLPWNGIWYGSTIFVWTQNPSHESPWLVSACFDIIYRKCNMVIYISFQVSNLILISSIHLNA